MEFSREIIFNAVMCQERIIRLYREKREGLIPHNIAFHNKMCHLVIKPYLEFLRSDELGLTKDEVQECLDLVKCDAELAMTDYLCSWKNHFKIKLADVPTNFPTDIPSNPIWDNPEDE